MNNPSKQISTIIFFIPSFCLLFDFQWTFGFYMLVFGFIGIKIFEHVVRVLKMAYTKHKIDFFYFYLINFVWFLLFLLDYFCLISFISTWLLLFSDEFSCSLVDLLCLLFLFTRVSLIHPQYNNYHHPYHFLEKCLNHRATVSRESSNGSWILF